MTAAPSPRRGLIGAAWIDHRSGFGQPVGGQFSGATGARERRAPARLPSSPSRLRGVDLYAPDRRHRANPRSRHRAARCAGGQRSVARPCGAPYREMGRPVRSPDSKRPCLHLLSGTAVVAAAQQRLGWSWAPLSPRWSRRRRREGMRRRGAAPLLVGRARGVHDDGHPDQADQRAGVVQRRTEPSTQHPTPRARHEYPPYAGVRPKFHRCRVATTVERAAITPRHRPISSRVLAHPFQTPRARSPRPGARTTAD